MRWPTSERPGAIGQIPVELELADEEGFPHRGSSNRSTIASIRTPAAILLRALFPNPDGRIVPGLFARIRVPASAKYAASLVEESAIGTDQAQKFVLTLTAMATPSSIAR